MLNPTLLAMAQNRAYDLEKVAVVPSAGPTPPGADPMAGGDPMAAAGGMAGAPPMGMPMDPAGAAPAAPPAPAGGGTPATIEDIAQLLQQTMAAGGGAGGKGAGKKPDVAVEMFQIKKLLVQIMQAMEIPLDPATVLGPDQAADPMAAGGAPGAPGAAPGAPGAAPGAAPMDPMAGGAMGMPPAGGPMGAPMPAPAEKAAEEVRIGSEFRGQAHADPASELLALAARSRSLREAVSAA